MIAEPSFGPFEVAVLMMLLGFLPMGQSLLTPLALFFIFVGVPVPEQLALKEPGVYQTYFQGEHPMSDAANTALSSEEIQTVLNKLPGWTYSDQALHKDYNFENFREAMSFLVRLSYEAETRNHHPEIHNVYNKVKLTLNTHDAGNQVTAKDLELAQAIEGFSWVK